MGDSLSLECSYVVPHAVPYAPYALHWAGVGHVLGGSAGCGRLKAPHIALPGYHNDSQELKVSRVASDSLQNFRLNLGFLVWTSRFRFSSSGFRAPLFENHPLNT